MNANLMLAFVALIVWLAGCGAIGEVIARAIKEIGGTRR